MLEDGTAFVTDEIRTFHERNDVQAFASAHYHRTTNNQPECCVAELKKGSDLQNTMGPLQRRQSRFLFRQHTTVYTGTGVTPTKAMFGSELLSPLYAILPTLPAAAHSKAKQEDDGMITRTNSAYVTVELEAELATWATSKHRTSFLVCIVRRQLQPSAVD